MGGRLDVGISGSLLYREVPRIMEHFQCAMPTVDVVLHEFSSAEQIEKMLRRQLDAGFAARLASQPASRIVAAEQ
jgi:DNA-binding transcriptional LysR family regulator